MSEFTLTKQTESEKLGLNKISLRFNTVFPKEKIAKSIFKDYDQIMQQQAAQKAQQAAQPETEGQAVAEEGK